MKTTKLTLFLLLIIAGIVIFIGLNRIAGKRSSENPQPLAVITPSPPEIAVFEAKAEALPEIELLFAEDSEILSELIAQNPLLAEPEQLIAEDIALLLENEILDAEEAEDILELENLLNEKR